MPFTFHCHSGEFCKHATGTLESIVQRAIALDFSHLGLSEHAPRELQEDLYPEEVELNMTPVELDAQFAAYVGEARRLQAKYAGVIYITVGMETEYIREADIERVKVLKERFRLDFVVGAVHHVRSVPCDFSADLYDKAEALSGSTEACFNDYLDHQYAVIERLRPTIVGHFDLIRMFRQSFALPHSTLERVRRNVQCAIDCDALFEINPRALKKGLPEPYPQMDILKIVMELGGRFTLCDDSHSPEQVGLFYREAHAYLERAGIDSLWALQLTESGVMERVRCDWRSHPAWRHFLL